MLPSILDDEQPVFGRGFGDNPEECELEKGQIRCTPTP